jgi:hypothetical protein
MWAGYGYSRDTFSELRLPGPAPLPRGRSASLGQKFKDMEGAQNEAGQGQV